MKFFLIKFCFLNKIYIKNNFKNIFKPYMSIQKKSDRGTDVGWTPDIRPEVSEKLRCPSYIQPVSWVLIFIGFYFADTVKRWIKAKIKYLINEILMNIGLENSFVFQPKFLSTFFSKFFLSTKIWKINRFFRFFFFFFTINM